MKKDIFNEIMGSLSESEEGVLEKKASDVTPINQKTEDVNYPARSVEVPTVKENKLGLSGLSSLTENYNKVSDSEAFGHDAGTENIKVGKINIETPTYLEKRASMMESLSEAMDIDLEKVASEEAQNDFLLKTAESYLTEASEDLNKIAMSMADSMADRFIERLRGEI